MLQKWIKAAKDDQPVWLSDVRENLAGLPDTVDVIARLLCWDGTARDFVLPVPRWKDGEERRFVREYVCACVFNILAALSGQRMTFYLDPVERDVTALLEELPGIFQVAEPMRGGYGKAVNVADRLSRAFGGDAFDFAVCDRKDHRPASVREKADTPKLPKLLVAAGARAEQGLWFGVDVGGTDIKTALSLDGKLIGVSEYDWNPAASSVVEEIIGPIVALVRSAAEQGGRPLDGLGISFPDVVIRNRIVGGETPKTGGMRANKAVDYEEAFIRLGALAEHLTPLCAPGAPVRITNDGHMAAFTAAMELACSGGAAELESGVIAHTLGTDLGSGWLNADGTIPESPMEFYDFLLDLGSWSSRELQPRDLRCVCNENSGLPGARRYLGQSAAFRLAQEIDTALLDGFTLETDGVIAVQETPDLRKPCLEHLMRKAEAGDAGAAEIFRRIGSHLGQVSRELDYLLSPAARTRFLFGRFVKHPVCFALLRQGCAAAAPELTLTAADDSLAATPLMRQLSQRTNVTVAQFGQAVGAIYFAAMEDETK